MAKNKVSEESKLNFINFLFAGKGYLLEKANNDPVELEKLKADIEHTGTSTVTFNDLATYITAYNEQIVKPVQTLNTDTLKMHEYLLKDNTLSARKLESLVEKLHETGDLSDDGYNFIKEHKFLQNEKDMDNAIDKVKADNKDTKAKIKTDLEKITKQFEKNSLKQKVKEQDEKSTVAEATYTQDDTKEESGKVITMTNPKE